MAHGRKTPPVAAQDNGEDDLAVMIPQVSLTLAGRDITVREYSFIQGLQMRTQLAAFVRDVDAVYAHGGEGLSEDILAVLSMHLDDMRHAIAVSAGVEKDWIDGLNEADGEQLLYAWWSVCGPFFLRLVLRRHLERTERVGQQASAGPTSSPRSSPPVTESQIRSSTTPTVN